MCVLKLKHLLLIILLLIGLSILLLTLQPSGQTDGMEHQTQESTREAEASTLTGVFPSQTSNVMPLETSKREMDDDDTGDQTRGENDNPELITEGEACPECRRVKPPRIGRSEITQP